MLVLLAPLLSAFSPGSPEGILSRWVVSEGGFIGPVIAEERAGRRGLFVTESIEAGTLLARVPKECCIEAEEDPQWGLSLRELLTARLVGALTRGEAAEYTESLPSVEPLLCDWSKAELDELQSRRMVELANGMLPFLVCSIP